MSRSADINLRDNNGYTPLYQLDSDSVFLSGDLKLDSPRGREGDPPKCREPRPGAPGPKRTGMGAPVYEASALE